ncbi:MAG: hypothetical protein COB22_02875 [Cycloclasticus sp.]|nr:MAG: hypothetical protein COB22_02875 [Cycloclasticus sp.]
MNKPSFITLGAILAFFAVALGAFGAHGLKNILSTESLAIFHTATDYQMWHSIGLLFIGLLHLHKPSALLLKAGWFMFAGILIFSGSLFILSVTGIKILGAVTPIGGVLFLIAWSMLAITATKIQ